MRVCSHWYARCHTPDIWEKFALLASSSKQQHGSARGRGVSVGRMPAFHSFSSTKLKGFDVDTLKEFSKLSVAQNAKVSRLHHQTTSSIRTDDQLTAVASSLPLARDAHQRPAAFSAAIDEHTHHQAATAADQSGLRRVAPWAAPLQSIDDEIEQAARDFFRGARHLTQHQQQLRSTQTGGGAATARADAPNSTQLEWLEVENTILQRRSARITVCSSELLSTSADDRGRLLAELEAAHEQEHEVATLDAALKEWSAVAEEHERYRERERAHREFCSSARSTLKALEMMVVKALLQAHHHNSSSSNDTTQRPTSAAATVVQLPHFHTFLELETYVLSGNHNNHRIASSLGVQWARFKRLFPVDDAYYDLKDAVLDETCSKHLRNPPTTLADDTTASSTLHEVDDLCDELKSLQQQQRIWMRAQMVVSFQRRKKEAFAHCVGSTTKNQSSLLDADELFGLIV